MSLLGNIISGTVRERSEVDDTPIWDASYAVIDTELTGLDAKEDSIISLGAVKITDMGIPLGEVFYRMARPESEMKSGSVAVHGLTPSDLEDQPELDGLIREFSDFVEGHVIVGHCVGVDMEFINRRLKKAGEPVLKGPFVDTYRIYRWLYATDADFRSKCPAEGAKDLYEMASMLGIPVSGTHDAIRDAFLTAQLFQRYIRMLARGGIDTLSRLARVADPSRGEETYCGCGVFGNF